MKLKGKNVIYTHAWEGGNEDHDSCFVIIKKFYLIIKKLLKVFNFLSIIDIMLFFIHLKFKVLFIKIKNI